MKYCQTMCMNTSGKREYFRCKKLPFIHKQYGRQFLLNKNILKEMYMMGVEPTAFRSGGERSIH